MAGLTDDGISHAIADEAVGRLRPRGDISGGWDNGRDSEEGSRDDLDCVQLLGVGHSAPPSWSRFAVWGKPSVVPYNNEVIQAIRRGTNYLSGLAES